MLENTYRVSLDNFQGPLGLLLSLIEKHKLDICDVSLASVTDDYLDYVRSADLDQHSANMFLDIAAQLILVKSKAILPSNDAELNATEDEDLTWQLKELAKYQHVQKKILSRSKFVQILIDKPKSKKPLSKIDLYQIKQSLLRLEQSDKQKPEVINYRLKRRYDRELKQKLSHKLRELKKLSVNNIQSISNDRMESITLFLLILEFVKSNQATIESKNQETIINFT